MERASTTAIVSQRRDRYMARLPATITKHLPTHSTGELLQTPKLPPPDEAPRRRSTPLYSAYLFPNIVQTKCVADQSLEVRPGVSDANKARARVAVILILSNNDPEERLARHLFSPRLASGHQNQPRRRSQPSRITEKKPLLTRPCHLITLIAQLVTCLLHSHLNELHNEPCQPSRRDIYHYPCEHGSFPQR